MERKYFAAPPRVCVRERASVNLLARTTNQGRKYGSTTTYRTRVTKCEPSLLHECLYTYTLSSLSANIHTHFPLSLYIHTQFHLCTHTHSFPSVCIHTHSFPSICIRTHSFPSASIHTHSVPSVCTHTY